MNVLLAGALVACSSKDDGYGVVDPMPEPARCAKDAAPKFKATATGAVRPDGKWDITVKLEAAPDAGAVVKSLDSTWSPNNDSKGTFTAEPGGGGTAVVTVASGSGSVRLVLGMVCGDAGAGRLGVEVVWKVGHIAEMPYEIKITPSP